MRKITKESAKAFVNFKPYKKDNTEVRVDTTIETMIDGKVFGWTEVYMFLHGNNIATIIGGAYDFSNNPNKKDGYVINLCGYHTRTTRERINGVLDALGYDFRIAQRKGEQVLVKTYVHNYLKPKQDILKLSDDSFDPEFAKKVFNSKEFLSGTDLNAITDF